MGHNTCEVGYWPVGCNVCFKLQFVVGAFSAVAEHTGLGTSGEEQAPFTTTAIPGDLLPVPAIMALFPREGGFHREEVGKLPSSNLDFLVSLDQQTENGVNFKKQGKMKLLLHSGGKEAINGARGIMSDAF